jgi:hypothetical protein
MLQYPENILTITNYIEELEMFGEKIEIVLFCNTRWKQEGKMKSHTSLDSIIDYTPIIIFESHIDQVRIRRWNYKSKKKSINVKPGYCFNQ